MATPHRIAAAGWMTAVLGLAGCHAGPNGSARNPADAPLTREAIRTDQLIADYNRNAAAIRSLKAISAAVEVQSPEQDARLDGRLAFERSRNFMLDLATPGLKQPVAKIGSNHREFWFWVKNNQKENPIYVCEYDRIDNAQIAASFQPDWIIEALGLREISDREAATIDGRPSDPSKGEPPGMMILTQIRRDPRSREEMLTKETIFNLETRRINQHRLYAGARKKLLAEATIDKYMLANLSPTDANPSGSQIFLPAEFRLRWIEEKFSMRVVMGRSVQVNPQIPDSDRVVLFSEPSIRNATRVDLSRQEMAQASAAPAPSAGRGRRHETIPAPRPGPIQLAPPDASILEVDAPGLRRGGTLPPMPELSTTDDRPEAAGNPGVSQAGFSGDAPSSPPRPAARPGWVGVGRSGS